MNDKSKENNSKKRVDDDYKEKVEREKQEKDQTQEQQNMSLPEVNFSIFISGIGMQTMVSLGELEDPFTKKKEVNLDNAKYLIDTLKMIKEKTLNNLDDQEQKILEDLLYQLQMKYVEIKK